MSMIQGSFSFSSGKLSLCVQFIHPRCRYECACSERKHNTLQPSSGRRSVAFRRPHPRGPIKRCAALEEQFPWPLNICLDCVPAFFFCGQGFLRCRSVRASCVLPKAAATWSGVFLLPFLFGSIDPLCLDGADRNTTVASGHTSWSAAFAC